MQILRKGQRRGRNAYPKVLTTTRILPPLHYCDETKQADDRCPSRGGQQNCPGHRPQPGAVRFDNAFVRAVYGYRKGRTQVRVPNSKTVPALVVGTGVSFQRDAAFTPRLLLTHGL